MVPSWVRGIEISQSCKGKNKSYHVLFVSIEIIPFTKLVAQS